MSKLQFGIGQLVQVGDSPCGPAPGAPNVAGLSRAELESGSESNWGVVSPELIGRAKGDRSPGVPVTRAETVPFVNARKGK